MIKTITLAPHEPMPTGHHVVVLRRLEEDSPGATTVQIILTGKREEMTHPRRPDGTLMQFDEAVGAARKVAASEGLDSIFILDRTQGPRERDILQHAGDHSVHMEALVDTDEEDGEHGPDMRDIAHPERQP